MLQLQNFVDPADDIPFPQIMLEASAHTHQEFVAGRVTEGVVDLFEFIQVEKKDRHGLAGALGAVDFPVEQVQEQGPAGEVGQGIVIGQKGDFLLALLQFRDIARDHRCVGDLRTGGEAGCVDGFDIVLLILFELVGGAVGHRPAPETLVQLFLDDIFEDVLPPDFRHRMIDDSILGQLAGVQVSVGHDLVGIVAVDEGDGVVGGVDHHLVQRQFVVNLFVQGFVRVHFYRISTRCCRVTGYRSWVDASPVLGSAAFPTIFSIGVGHATPHELEGIR